MTSRLRLLVPLFAAAALVAGCAETDEQLERASASTEANALLRDTFVNLGRMTSATVDLKVRVTPGGTAAAHGPVSAHLRGAFASQDAGELPKFALTATLESGGKTFDGGATWTGEDAYVTVKGTPYEVPGLVTGQLVAGLEQAQKSTGGGLLLAGLGVDVTRWLKDARNEGLARVGDAETVKISGGADVARVIGDLETLTERARALNLPGLSGKLPQPLTEARKRAAVDAVKALTVTVYTGADDRILRRLTVTADVEDAASDANAALLLDLTFTKVGDDQDITAPDDPRPFGELLQAFDGAGLRGLGLLTG